MEIKRSGSQPSGKGPADWFTGTVRIDPLFSPPDGTVSGLVVQAAMATGGFRSLAAWKRCPKPVPSVPL